MLLFVTFQYKECNFDLSREVLNCGALQSDDSQFLQNYMDTDYEVKNPHFLRRDLG